MSSFITLAALALLIFYLWGLVAFWQAASRERLKLLWILVAWNCAAAAGSLFFLLDGASDRFSLLGSIGGFAAIATPFLWSLGRVGARLRQYGLSYAGIYSFSR